jgi:hypothetical protein
MMKRCLTALLLAPMICLGADSKNPESENEPPPLTPGHIVAHGQALKNAMKEVVVRFDVAAIATVPTAFPDGTTHEVLHLVPSGIGAKFTAPISPKFEERLKQIGITDIRAHFEGATVTLKGHVSGTGMALVLSPTVWTYHVQLQSFENIRSVKRP